MQQRPDPQTRLMPFQSQHLLQSQRASPVLLQRLKAAKEGLTAGSGEETDGEVRGAVSADLLQGL